VVVAGGAVVVVAAPERPPDPHPAPTTLMVTARKSEADNRMTGDDPRRLLNAA
jgi:hypothetical protein